MHESHKYAHMSSIQMKTLPKIGFIAYLNDTTPIAAGFLRRLEPCYGQIDTLVTNNYMGSIIRHKGLEIVIKALMDEAEVLKLDGLICHTGSEDVIKRSEIYGFTVVNQKIIAKRLK